jgi:hypothetical protein
MRRLLHNAAVGLLILVSSLTFVLTAIAGWSHQTALNTDRFVGVVTDVTSDPQVVDSLSARVADQVVTRLGLEQRVANLLPDSLDRLAVPVTEAVHDRIDAAVSKLLTNAQFQTFWTNALTRLHAGLLNIVDGKAEFFTTTNGKLTLDLLAVIDTVIGQLQEDGVLPTAADFPRFAAVADRTDFLARLSTYVNAQLPPDFGMIPIADASAVQSVADALRLFDQVIIGLGIATAVLALLGVILADRRWRAILWLGITIEVMLGLVLVILVATQRSASGIVANPDNRVLLAGLVGRLAESLTLWLAVIAVAVLLVIIPAAFLSRRDRTQEAQAAS